MTRDVDLHSCEIGTFAPRNGTIPDGILIHTTECAGFPRLTSVHSPDALAFVRRICDRAVALPGLKREQADTVTAMAQVDGCISDALRLCVQAAGLPRTASWHYCVASKPLVPDGAVDVVEYVSPTLQAHHCGSLGLSVNRRSIGIECCYPGSLSKRIPVQEAEGIYEGWGWPKPEIQTGPDKVKRWYTPMHPAAFEALVALCVRLVQRFPGIYWIGGHYQFAPSKRIDPDPPVSLQVLRAMVEKQTGRPLVSKPRGAPKRER